MGAGQDSQETARAAREGRGSAEATEMITNNLFYITVKFGDENPKEVEDLWQALCDCWPKNLKIVIRYLFIVSGIAPNELVEYVSSPLNIQCYFVFHLKKDIVHDMKAWITNM